MTGSRHEAEEIAQEAYVRVLERWDHVQRLDDPTGYLFVTAMNVFRKRIRRAGIALRRSIGTAPSQDAFGAVEDRAVVLDASAQLPLDQRAALVVTALLGYSSEDGRTDARHPALHGPSPSHEGPRRPTRTDR